MKREDLKGNKYGYLTVLEMVYNSKLRKIVDQEHLPNVFVTVEI